MCSQAWVMTFQEHYHTLVQAQGSRGVGIPGKLLFSRSPVVNMFVGMGKNYLTLVPDLIF